MISVKTNKSDFAELRRILDRMSLEDSDKQILRIMGNASLPIRKAAKRKARAKIKANNGFTFTRKGTTYEIEPRTIEKSIGNIPLKRARAFMVDVGYRAGNRKYDGWFAHFVDAGTAKRETKAGANRGSIEPQNIMQAGIKGIPKTQAKLNKEILKFIRKNAK